MFATIGKDGDSWGSVKGKRKSTTSKPTILDNQKTLAHGAEQLLQKSIPGLDDHFDDLCLVAVGIDEDEDEFDDDEGNQDLPGQEAAVRILIDLAASNPEANLQKLEAHASALVDACINANSKRLVKGVLELLCMIPHTLNFAVSSLVQQPLSRPRRH